MSRVRSDEEKILFDPYVSITTIIRYFSINKVEARHIFTKAQELDEEQGYLTPYTDRVRTEAVLQLMGLDYDKAIKRFELKRKWNKSNA